MPPYSLYTELLRPYNNCFQPVMKLIRKDHVGERTRKIYDTPTSPLRRVLDAGAAAPLKIGASLLAQKEKRPRGERGLFRMVGLDRQCADQIGDVRRAPPGR